MSMSMSMGSVPRASSAYPVISAVLPGTPAHRAGLEAGDQILEIGGRDAREEGALRVQAGVRYTYRIRRGQEEREVTLVAAARPPRPGG
jgi:S1-C subfamily serine protease